jgi:hypothetical protein
VVIDMTRCSGGVTHESIKLNESRNGDSVETESKIIKHVDHERAVAKIAQARSKVIGVIKKHCKHTPVGYICPEGRITRLESDLQAALAACADANQFAEIEGSARRIRPGITYATVDWNDPSVTTAVFESLAEKVQAQLDLAKSLPVERLSEVKQELLQISTVVSGPARTALEYAARDIPAIMKARKDGADPDYSVLEAAVQWFRV